MSGLIGYVGWQPEKLSYLAQEVRQRLCRFPWNTWDWWTSPDETLGIGRVDIGIFNPQPQPVASPDGQVLAFLSGELYRAAELRRALTAAGAGLRRNDDTELVLHAYLSYGPDFVKRLEGAFHLAILDQRHHTLLIANDRFGLRPLYFTQYQGQLAFAPEVKALTFDPAFEKKLSLVAVAEYMRFQQLLGEKTFFEDVYLLPPASLLTYDLVEQRLTIGDYWSFASLPRLDPKTPYQEIVEESARLFQQAVDTLSSDGKRIGLYLTGGLDSRLIAGCLAKCHAGFPTISYGDPRSVDVQLAKRIACLLGADHHIFEFTDGRWVQEYADLHLELTDGHHSWIHSHGISTLIEARSLLAVNLPGWGMDTGLGGLFWDRLADEAQDEWAFACRIFHMYVHELTWPGLTEEEAFALYNERYRSCAQELPFQSLQMEVQKLARYPFAQRAEYLTVLQHNRRMTHNYLVFNGSHFENRIPGYDYQLFDFVYALPPNYGRPSRRLQKDIIEYIAPELALIPFGKDNLLFTRRSTRRIPHHLLIRLKQRFNRHITKVFPEPQSLYADYENWLRHELRPWAEDILFDGRLDAREIFDPAGVKSLFDRHMSGRELHTIGKIAPIMTLEMVLRAYFD